MISNVDWSVLHAPVLVTNGLNECVSELSLFFNSAHQIQKVTDHENLKHEHLLSIAYYIFQ